MKIEAYIANLKTELDENPLTLENLDGHFFSFSQEESMDYLMHEFEGETITVLHCSFTLNMENLREFLIIQFNDSGLFDEISPFKFLVESFEILSSEDFEAIERL